VTVKNVLNAARYIFYLGNSDPKICGRGKTCMPVKCKMCLPLNWIELNGIWHMKESF
jgi:hypothetical protein